MKRMTVLLLPFLLVAGCEKPKPTYPAGTGMAPVEISVGFGATTATGDTVSLSPQNTKIAFVGTKPMGKHDGEFKKFAGTIKLDKAGSATVSSITVDIEAESISTDNPGLTNHLKQPEFFDVKQFPKATFASTKVEPVAGKDGEFTVTGDLTIHGVKNSITFPAKAANANDNFSLSSTFKIQWKDFMAYAKPGIDPDVTISVNVGSAAK